jgi:peroxidase
MQYKKNLWEVETGRRDGTISNDQEALRNIPAPSSTLDVLLANFSSKGLGLQDLVVLSGTRTHKHLPYSLSTHKAYVRTYVSNVQD